ncbi:MAG: mannose-1-phosphate guanylyltransferase [Chitinophagaceae bacterium]|jgi:mannose-1-phosphate guanylyltransferase|nr:mannose-1-phosphate guanylyltransferase [Chitinophagaceae bacterium]MBK9466078.1 mannose-1-phosphate guanylyltransferase [Chitinophagaceae bacterium]MBK9661349.1 mannose-1-phosphate guanylyltransferase [Chitinophagaceae bacterium]MBK9938620.1 mannose-1-phosphate guanylyltransferase [Chitinophagaceae bacterium]MBP6232761.1 mannose-1-phosphate guanylyltransferase [Chitinophagaceae bacterium]
MNKHHYVAIMAGGIGSRFWPMSRTDFPKQFLDILGTGKTLIQQTFDRYSKLVQKENIYVVTAQEYVSIVKKQLPDIPEENILAEPSRKNTAPCIAYIAFKLLKKDPKALMVAAPADNLILETDEFIKTAKKALSFVDHINALVTIGVKPTYPNTGYGYIQHDTTEAAPGVYKVKTFTEKPNVELAKTFMSSGDFLWNAGIFTWKVKNIIAALEKYEPELYELFAAEKDKFNTAGEKEVIENIYPQCTNISIDFAIMEKADNVYLLPASFGWSDLGTWNSAWENKDKDYFGNAVVGKNVMVVDANNCMVHVPDNKLVMLQGLKDYIIVDTKDVLLICKKDKEQEIKEYVAEVKRNKGDKYL